MTFKFVKPCLQLPPPPSSPPSNLMFPPPVDSLHCINFVFYIWGRPTLNHAFRGLLNHVLISYSFMVYRALYEYQFVILPLN